MTSHENKELEIMEIILHYFKFFKEGHWFVSIFILF